MVSASRSTVQEGLSTVTRGTLLLLVSTLCLVGITFVWRVILYRYFGNGSSELNGFFFGLALAGVIGAVGTLGLPSAVARSIPYSQTDAERRTIVRATLLIGGAASVASSVVLWAFAGTIGQDLGQKAIGIGLEYFPIAVGTSIFASLISSIFQGYEDVIPNAVFVSILTPALFVAFLGVALFLPPYGLSYTDALIAYAAANAATLGLLAVYGFVRLPRRLPPGPRAPEALGRLLRFAAPLFVVSIMGSLTGSGDTLVLGIFDPGQIATYTASLTLARLLQIGIGALGFIFLPVATKFLRHDDRSSIQLTYATATKWMILFSLPLFLLFFLLPSLSLGFVYGPTYTSVVVPLQITVLGAFATTLLGPSTTTQVVYGQTSQLMYNSIAAGLVDLGVAFALVPGLGYTGAAIAWAAANVTYTGLSLGELAYLSDVHPFRRDFVVPLLVTALPMGALLLVLAASIHYLWLPVLGFGIAGLFVVFVLLTKSVDEGDRLLLDAVERLVGFPLAWVRRIGRYGLRRRP